MSIDLEGTIHPTSLPSLLYSVCDTKETGQLLLRHDKAEKNVYLKDGRIIFSSSSNREDRLGQVLLRRGIIGVEQLYRASEESLRTRKRLGTVLVESGWMAPEELVQGVILQVEEILFDSFLWDSGTYKLSLGDLPTQEDITLSMNSRELILRGVRRIQSWYRISEALGDLEVRYQATPQGEEIAAGMSLGDQEQAVFGALQTPVAVSDVLQRFSGRDLAIGQLLWALQTTRAIARV